MKHVGKMKNNSARIAVVFRTVPGEPTNALVVGTNGLPDSYHDSLMSIIESDGGQQANELADILAVRRFPDGEVMLSWLHTRGHMKKVPTNLVLMTPNNQTQIQLDELNKIIAEQKGTTLEEIAGDAPNAKPPTASKTEEVVVPATVEVAPVVVEQPVTASDLRSMADKLFKEAQSLRKKADTMEPTAPTSKKKSSKAEV